MQRSNRIAGLALLGFATVLLTLGLGSAAAAQPLRQPAGPPLLTIPAGQTASLNVMGFCLDFGKPFPAASQAPSELAQAQIRAGLNYAASKGYTQSDPRQVQEAIWFLASGNWHRPDHTLGTEIANAAKDPANAPAAVTGTSLIDALKANNLTATITFAPPAGTPPADAAYGTGVLQIKNTGSQDVSIYLPVGSVFPPANAADQRLVGYALGVAQAAPTATVAPTNTTAPTATAAPTNTAAPTTTPEPAATALPAATSTPANPSLPKTGGEPGSPLAFLLIGAGLLALCAGLVLLRRSAPAP